MKIKIINYNFSVVTVTNYNEIDLNDEYIFLGKTDEENSLVCITEHTPKNTIKREDGWKCFKVDGVLDFSLVGIMSKISTILAETKIPLYAVSTYNTDYILTKEENFEKAIQALEKHGYIIEGE